MYCIEAIRFTVLVVGELQHQLHVCVRAALCALHEVLPVGGVTEYLEVGDVVKSLGIDD